MGIVLQNAGGFGSLREAAQVWTENELEPRQARLAQVDEWLGEEVVRFDHSNQTEALMKTTKPPEKAACIIIDC
jgi:hypothetical protein